MEFIKCRLLCSRLWDKETEKNLKVCVFCWLPAILATSHKCKISGEYQNVAYSNTSKEKLESQQTESVTQQYLSKLATTSYPAYQTKPRQALLS